MTSLFKTTSQKLTDALWERLKFNEEMNKTGTNSVNLENKAAQLKEKTQQLYDKYVASEGTNTSAKTQIKTEYYAFIMQLLDLLEQNKYNEIINLREKASKLYRTNIHFKRKEELRNLSSSIIRIAAFSPGRTVPLLPISINTSNISTSTAGIENWGVTKPVKKRRNTHKLRKARKFRKTRKY